MTHGWGFCLLALLALSVWGGCAGPASTDTPNAPTATKEDDEVVALKLVVVNDPSLADAIRREWQARSKEPLEVQSVLTPGKMPAQAPAGDIIVYSVNRLGELTEKNWIAPLPEVSLRALDADRDDLSNFALRQECSWGGAVFGIPLGSTCFTLYARADLLRDNGLSLPTTWEEYAAVVKRLRASDWAKEKGHVVAAEPTSSAWAGVLLLARSAAYVRHRGNYSTYFDFQSMEPLIDSPPMVKALEELAAASDAKDFDAMQLTPADCLDLFWRGDAALAIGLVGHLGKKDGAKISPEQVAVSELPGSPQVYVFADKRWEKRGTDELTRIPLLATSGRVGSILTSSPHKIAAARALQLISSTEWSPTISPESMATGPFRRSQLKEVSRWVEPHADARLRRDMADLFATRFETRLAMTPPRVPGGSRYLDALDGAVHAALMGKVKPQGALAIASIKWREITAELGVAAQKGAYRRSLGLKE